MSEDQAGYTNDAEREEKERAEKLAKELAEELARIAAKHKVKDVFRIESENAAGDKAISYHRRPSRTDYGSALSVMDRNPLTAKEIIIRTTFLEGDSRVMDDDEFFYSACTVIDELLTIKMASIKKN
jgi:hypothetical protein